MKKIVFVSMGFLAMLIILYTEFIKIESEEVISTEPIVTIELSTGDLFKMRLHPDEAPNTVNNFLYLAELGFYEGTSMSRAIADYLVQIGDPIGNGQGFPGYFIESECRYNGIKNTIKHKRGTVSMARSDQFNTEGSQFFIMLEDDSHLDGQYSAFATIIEGIEFLDELSRVDVSSTDRPLEAIYIESIRIETMGESYGMPEIITVKEALAHGEV